MFSVDLFWDQVVCIFGRWPTAAFLLLWDVVLFFYAILFLIYFIRRWSRGE